MWFGTDTGGIVRLSGRQVDRWTTVEGLPHDDVRAIAFDSVGGTWVGTMHGLALIHNESVRSFTTEDGLTSAIIRTLSADANGSIWIGTNGGGLVRFKDGIFRAVMKSDGMFDNIVSHYYEGPNGFVWMGSNRGIWRVSKEELVAVTAGRLSGVTSIAYGQTDGLTFTETSGGFQPNGLILANGDILFSTVDGVARVRTTKFQVNTTPPPVIIERIRADARDLTISSTIEIPGDVEDVEITYTALSFTAPEKVRFRYRLSGYNKNWVDAGAKRNAVFTNVAPGTYVFSVTAANNEGIWNEDGAELTMVVLTPFWQTIWFRGLAVLALVGMGMLVVSIRLRQVRRQKELQEETSQRLIQSQEEERQRIAGELHDSLGQELIVAKNRIMLAAHHLPQESQARSELTQVGDALSVALKSVRSIAYNLRPFQLDQLGLTETIKATVRTIQQATKIVFETEIENIDGTLDHNGEIGLFRIVQEALTPGTKMRSSYASMMTVSGLNSINHAMLLRFSDSVFRVWGRECAC
jgi:hypothetical protein